MTEVIELSKVQSLRRLNKSELAEFFGVSPQALDGWIRRGCPSVARGQPGKPWVFDALDVARWRFEGERIGDDGQIDPETLSAQDRKAWYEGTLRRLELETARGELYQRDEVIRVITTTIAVFTEQMRALPDKLEREAGINGAQAEVAERVIDSQLEDLKSKILTAVNGG